MASGGLCQVAPSAPALPGLTVSHLNVEYDQSLPLFVGHPLPLRMGVTSRGATTQAAPVPVRFVVALVEHFDGTPTEAQYQGLARCVVGGFVADLEGADAEQEVTPELIIPPECLPTGRDNVVYNVLVEVDPDSLVTPSSAEHYFSFTDAHQGAPSAAQCRSSFAADAPVDGCVHRLQVRASPGLDVHPTLEPQSQVGVFWPQGGRELVTVQMARRVYGHDPYDLDDADAMLPGDVVTTARIAPSAGEHAGEWLPLALQSGTAGAPPASERVTNQLAPASENSTAYDLYAMSDVLERVGATGAWSNVDEFTIEVCERPSFAEEGELGDPESPDEDQPGAQTAASDNCQRFSLLGVRSVSTAAMAASRVEFNAEPFGRTWSVGLLDFKLNATSENRMFIGGTSSDNNVSLAIEASPPTIIQQLLQIKPLPIVTLATAHAYAGLDLEDTNAPGLNLWLEIFGNRVFNHTVNVPSAPFRFNPAWSLDARKCKSFIVVVGYLPLTVEGCISGGVGLGPDVGYNRNVMGSQRMFPQSEVEAQVNFNLTPTANLGVVFGVYIDGLVGRAGIEGQARGVTLSMPFHSNVAVGLTRADPMFAGARTGQVSAGATLDLDITPPTGRVIAYVDVLSGPKWCWAFPPVCRDWRRHAEETLWSTGYDTIRRPLLNETRRVTLTP